MKVKYLLSVLLSAAPFAAWCQHYCYVNADKLNVRNAPDSSGAKVSSLTRYDVAEVIEPGDEWTRVSFKDYDDNFEEVRRQGYVATRYVSMLEPCPVTDALANRDFVFAESEPRYIAYSLEIEDDNGVLRYAYRLASIEMQEMGGSGTLDWGSGRIASYGGDFYSVTDTSMSSENGAKQPLIYDCRNGMLYLCGYLWQVK